MESVRESAEAAAAELSGGEPAGGDDQASVPAAPEVAEPDRAETARESLEAARDQHEAARTEASEFDELFKPLAGRMAEAKLTRAAVTKMAFAAAEQLSRLAQDPREAFAAIATHLRSQGLDPGQIPAAIAAAPTTPAGPSPQLIERANAEIAAFASARAA